jgi:hypothetical protein
MTLKIKITRAQLLNTKGNFKPVDLKPLVNAIVKPKLDTFILRVASFLINKEDSNEGPKN